MADRKVPWWRRKEEPEVEILPREDQSGPQPGGYQPDRRASEPRRRQPGEPRLTNGSAISHLSVAAIQAALTTADGFVAKGPGGKGKKGMARWAQGIVSPPGRARIVVVVLRRGEKDTSVSVVIRGAQGEKVTTIDSPRVLWEGNVDKTARTIATLLQRRDIQRSCQVSLRELLGEAPGEVRSFYIDPSQRLMITDKPMEDD